MSTCQKIGLKKSNEKQIGLDYQRSMIKTNSMISIVHADLVALRDNGQLIPGKYYRITDYVTTVNQHTNSDARSVGHPFDIIVVADSPSTINERAHAAIHEGDEYFNGSMLNAWEIKYRLENVFWSLAPGVYMKNDEGYLFKKEGYITIDGITYTKWAGDSLYNDDYGWGVISTTDEIGAQLYVYYNDDAFSDETSGFIESIATEQNSGKGTIVYLKDEHNNECSYDFKNIQFKRWKVTDEMESRDGLNNTYLGVLNNTSTKLIIENEEDFIFAFTFSSDQLGGEQEDVSVKSDTIVENNIINTEKNDSLPNNVFFGTYTVSNKLSESCHNNSFAQACYNNSFAQGCHNNSFAQGCYNNSFAQGCYNNSFALNCSGNSFAQDCYNNSFAQGCYNNSFALNCTGNSFEQGCRNNSFAQDCFDNSFAQGCYNNSFAQGCYNNSFALNCSNNSFAQVCYNNSFEQNCSYNSFEQECSLIQLTKHMTYISVCSGNRFLTLTCTESVASNRKCKNIRVNSGVNNTYTMKTITIDEANQNYQTVIASADDTTITV